jgi:hypothetical protein
LLGKFWKIYIDVRESGPFGQSLDGACVVKGVSKRLHPDVDPSAVRDVSRRRVACWTVRSLSHVRLIGKTPAMLSIEPSGTGTQMGSNETSRRG